MRSALILLGLALAQAFALADYTVQSSGYGVAPQGQFDAVSYYRRLLKKDENEDESTKAALRLALDQAIQREDRLKGRRRSRHERHAELHHREHKLQLLSAMGGLPAMMRPLSDAENTEGLSNSVSPVVRAAYAAGLPPKPRGSSR